MPKKSEEYIVKNGKKGNFTICTWEAYDAIKDPLAFVVYFTLKRFADFSTGENCYVSDAKASKVSGISMTTFKARREYLRQLGWITWTSGKENGTTNMYLIHETLRDEVDATRLPLAHTELPPSRQTATQVDATRLQPTPVLTPDINQQTLPVTTISSEEDPVKEIFGFWQVELGHQDKRYTPGRKEKIKARLSDGFTVEQLKNVIRYVKTNSFLRGQNPRNKAYDDFENIFRKTERVEAYLGQYAKEIKNPRIISTEEDRKKVQGKWLREN